MDPALQSVYKDFFETTTGSGLLYGTWKLQDLSLILTMNLVDLGTRRLIAKEDCSFDLQNLPANLNFVPSEFSAHEAKLSDLNLNLEKDSLRVTVSTDRGSSGVYMNGETMKILVSITEQAYLCLYIFDASGKAQRIFPIDSILTPWLRVANL